MSNSKRHSGSRITSLISSDWPDYRLIDSGHGQRLERFGQYTIVKPDPQAIWEPSLPESDWQKADAVFQRINENAGRWQIKNMPKKWLIEYRDLKLWCQLSPFKHTGVFPEQSAHWQWLSDIITNHKRDRQSLKDPLNDGNGTNKNIWSYRITTKPYQQVSILNLFGYTGIASLVAAQAGAKVTHVDSSKPTIGWARDNQKASGLEDKPIRWILDDCLRFAQRELKRGQKYDGIIMDPPIFGHGPDGRLWKFNRSFPELVAVCSQLLTEAPLFFLVNAYAISSSALMLENVLKDYLKKFQGTFETGELILEQQAGKRSLSTGIFCRFSKTAASDGDSDHRLSDTINPDQNGF